MWIDKAKFHDLIKRYQELNDDLDSSWLDSKIIKLHYMTDESFEKYKTSRTEFRQTKMKWYRAKKRRMAKETEEQKRQRHMELSVVEEELFETFYTLIDSVSNSFGLHTLKGDEWYEDLRQDIITRLLAVVNRFDIRRPNPLAYFIQVIKNLAYNLRDDEWRHRMRNLTESFLTRRGGKETEDEVDVDVEVEMRQKQKPEEKKVKSLLEDFLS